VVIAKRAHAHNLYFAVCFYEDIWLDAECEIDVRRVLRINAQAVNPPYLGASRIADGRTRLQPAREFKVGVVGFSWIPKRAIDRENGYDEYASGNQHKQSDERLFGFWAHHFPYFSTLRFSDCIILT
jgi:hypothetical protein